MADQPQSDGPRRGPNYGLIALAVAALLVLIQLSALVFQRQQAPVVQVQATNTAQRPTRTNTPVPPTNTPTSTRTATPTWTPSPVPPTEAPTETPVPPTETPVPPTETPAPTNTPVPPTPRPATPRPNPPTAVPPTAAPAPLAVLQEMTLDNGQWGKNWMKVKYQDDMYATGKDGHRYKLELGLLSSPQAQQRIQDFWGYGSRGSANWTMTILVHEEVNWVSCSSSSNICYEGATNSGQANFTAKVFYKPKVWESLLNDYIDGGLNKTFSNGYYNEIQKSIFRPMCNCDKQPEFPVIGFIFTRVS